MSLGLSTRQHHREKASLPHAEPKERKKAGEKKEEAKSTEELRGIAF